MFISGSELRAVWEHYDLSTIFPQRGWTFEQYQQIRNEYLKILSILIWIGWRDLVGQFRALFFTRPDRKDRNLPIAEENLSFLGGSALTFYVMQYAFVPVVIHDMDKMHVHRLGPLERLPFIEETYAIGCGGFGEVSKVVIAPRCLHRKGLDNCEVKSSLLKEFPSLNIISRPRRLPARGTTLTEAGMTSRRK